MPILKKEDLQGAVRIKTANLQTYKKTARGWVRIANRLPDTQKVIELYLASKNIGALVDRRSPEFLKGELTPEGLARGARVVELPDGQELEKPYSLFSSNLRLHDQTSHDHWDVMYQNSGGTWAYLYTKEKKQQAKRQKYSKVEAFNKSYPVLKNALAKDLNRNNTVALSLYTLLETKMRVGSETYFKAHGHKGLTTLQKKDIKIKGNNATFSFIGKDGVPQTITSLFPKSYIDGLQKRLKSLNANDFVFTNSNGHPLSDMNLKAGFKRYCGEEYYPHIVRSHYATQVAQRFLETHESATKQDVQALFLNVAHDLGHKKFDKKTGQWHESYAVTIKHYIQPELVNKLQDLAGLRKL